MALDELVKVGVGVGFSAVLGLLLGYKSAGHDESISSAPKEKRTVHRILDHALAAALGLLPQISVFPSEYGKHLLSFGAGVCGAAGGNFLGKTLWHRSHDSSSLLNEEEEEVLQRYGSALKTALVVSEKEGEAVSRAHEQSIMKIAQKKYQSPRFWAYVDNVRKEAVEYARWHTQITEIMDSRDTIKTVAIKGERIKSADGILYIIEDDCLHSFEVEVGKARFFSRDTQESEKETVQANITYTVSERQASAWSRDISMLAEEIVQDDRIVFITAGEGPLELKKSLVFDRYKKAAGEYLIEAYLRQRTAQVAS
ncbi:MAG: hypothetical protein V1743_06240 [Nanoarchaeota archaeon]